MLTDKAYAKLRQAEEGSVGLEAGEGNAAQLVKAKMNVPPTIVKAIIDKPTKEVPLGIQFSAQSSGWIRIDGVVPGHLADQACPGVFKRGMKLLSLNGHDFQRCTAAKERLKDLITLLQSLEGEVVVVASSDKTVGYISYTRSSFTEPFLDEPVETDKPNVSWPGLTFLSITGHGMAVGTIFEKSPFLARMKESNVRLQALDKILNIETDQCDIDCRLGMESSQELERKLRDVPEGGKVTIYFDRGDPLEGIRSSIPPPSGQAPGGTW
ncbi:MAG: hypothetical protein SGARI_004766, partial [Bacillariaceae sp.]